MPSPILSTHNNESAGGDWTTAPEEEPLLEASKAKAASVTARSPPATAMGIDPVAAPPGTAPIQLPPDVDLSADYPFNNQPIATAVDTQASIASGKAHGWIPGSMPSDTKAVFRYIGRGCFIMLMAPIAFTGMALYATGAILEGAGMVLKGVGAVGGNLMLARRDEGQKSPVIQPAIAWV